MATSKKAISAYLPTDVEEYLTKYCTEYNITRKDKSGEIKPALGTAVVEILRIFFSNENVPSPLPDNVPLLPSNVITEDRLSEALSELKNSSNVIGNLPSNVFMQNELDKRLGNLDDRIETAIVNLKNDEEFLRAIAVEVQKINITTDDFQYSSENALEDGETEEDEENITQIDKASLAPIFEEVEAEKSTASNSLTDGELAKVLSLNKSTIYRYRTGKPKKSQSYQQVMQAWKPIGDRWYKQGE